MPVDELTTERILEGVARIGQHRFAAGVLANCGGSCVFCGSSRPDSRDIGSWCRAISSRGESPPTASAST